jgi:hypothetical protein
MSNWQLVSYWGSLRDGDSSSTDSAFHAGHVNDVLRLDISPFNPILAASDTSGVWLINETGGMALPLGWNWQDTSFACLCKGIHGPQHVYAAGSALYETDVTKFAPLLNWNKITIQDAAGLILNVGQIYRVVVVNIPMIWAPVHGIVLATDTGVYWSVIPGAGGAYAFKLVTTLPGTRFSGLAEGFAGQIVAGAWGTDGAKHCGIFLGNWTGPGGDLVFTPSTITGSINSKNMLRTEVASCAGDRSRLYAVCSGGGNLTAQVDAKGNVITDQFGNIAWTGDELIYRVLRSTDGGNSWTVTGNTVNGSSALLFGGPTDVIGHTQGGYNICIGVSPFNPKLVAIGIGGPAISRDNGNTWDLLSSSHLHADIHGVVFDQTDPARSTLFICSDGGVAKTPDLGKTFNTACNRQFPNFQFRRFAASPVDSGLIAGSLQDNGDVYTTLYVNADPWRDRDGGDGVLTSFLATGHLVFNNNTLAAKDKNGNSVEFGAKTRISTWDIAKRTFADLKLFPDQPLSQGVIPVDATADGLLNGGGNVGSDVVNLVEAVTVPSWKNTAAETMLAVAVEGEQVFGLFQKNGGDFHWTMLASIPHEPDKDKAGKELPYFGTASASLYGETVLVGTNNGKIFEIDSSTGNAVEKSIPKNTTSIRRFATIDKQSWIVIAGASAFRFDGATWTTLGGGLPGGQNYTALTADRTTNPPLLYVATNAGIWKSSDLGNTWFADDAGLPTSPNCRDLRVVTESSGVTFLYLSTYGWSVFRKVLNMDIVSRAITIEGHMDMVDRQVIDPDIWAHPKFSNILKVGTLHPFEEMTVTEDDGDEIRVSLKISLAWHMDFSVDVTFDATLFAKDEDNAIDDHTSGSLHVPFGQSPTQVIDLASDEWWPDRAHIEFKVVNT